MKIGRKDVMFDTRNVLYFEADAMYCIIHFEGGRTRTYARTLAHLQRLITDSSFVRIHQKYLVRVAAICTICSKEVHLSNKAILPISRRNRKNLQT